VTAEVPDHLCDAPVDVWIAGCSHRPTRARSRLFGDDATVTLLSPTVTLSNAGSCATFTNYEPFSFSHRPVQGPGMTAAEDEAAEFARVVAALVGPHWGPAMAAASADLGELWRVAAGQGWFDLGPAEALVVSISSGTLRVLVAAVPHLDAAGAGTHVLLLPPGGGSATLHPVIARRPTPGLAVPAWSEVALGRPAGSGSQEARVAEVARPVDSPAVPE
jgi:hypothetical protein